MATTISSGRANSPLLTANIADHGTIYGGRGLVFDGVSDYIINDSFTAHQTDTGTLSCWVKPTNISSWQFYFGVGGIDSANVMRAIAQSDGTLWFIDNGSGWNTGLSIGTGSWYHLAITWNGTSVKFYRNGIGYSQTQSSILTPTGTDIIIGAKPIPTPAHFTNGTISDAKMFNATLTEAQVQELYLKPEQSAPSAVQDNLVAWYPMCEGNPDSPQSIVYDHSEKKLGSDIVDNNTTSAWTKEGTNSEADITNGVRLTYGSAAGGNYAYINDTLTSLSGLATNTVYKSVCTVSYSGGTAPTLTLHDGATAFNQTITTTPTEYTFYFERNGSPYLQITNQNSGNVTDVINWSIKAVTSNTGVLK